MASLVIRNLDDSLKQTLRLRAASNGQSMEEEARQILRAALRPEKRPRVSLADAVRARFAPLGGVDLPPIDRDGIREPPDFGA